MPVLGSRSSVLVAVAAAATLATGCSSPIGVERASAEQVHVELSGTVLSTGELSSPARNLFRRANLLETFERDPVAALSSAHDLLTQRQRGRLTEIGSRGLVSLAEACFLHASRSGDRSYFLMAAIYAWAFLFAEDTPLAPLDPAVRLAANLYNRGLTLAIIPDTAEEGIYLRSGTFPLPIGELEVELDPEQLRWGDRVFTGFTPVADLKIRGLVNRYRVSGLGAPLAAATDVLGADRPSDPVHAAVQVPVSLVLILDDVLAGLKSGRLRGHLQVHAELKAPNVTVAGRSYPAEQEPSASLALMLSQVQPWRGELRALFQGDLRRERDGLTSLSLHRPGRIPVVLVHGTASSTATWANMLNDLHADPEIRGSFQFWLFTYNTGAPLLYSASLLRNAVNQLVDELDPEGRDGALRSAVIVGHSQGGLLSKLLAVRSGDVYWDRISDEPIESLDMKPETRALIESAIFFEPSPAVRRVVFIATPHHGSHLLTWSGANLLRNLVRAPSTVVRATTDLVSQNPESSALRRIDDVDGALGQMSPSNPFLATLLDLPVEPPIESHSIIAVKRYGPKDEVGDGVVAYESAHIDDVESEVVVESGHSCLDHPEVVEELRRILLTHLETTRFRLGAREESGE